MLTASYAWRACTRRRLSRKALLNKKHLPVSQIARTENKIKRTVLHRRVADHDEGRDDPLPEPRGAPVVPHLARGREERCHS